MYSQQYGEGGGIKVQNLKIKVALNIYGSKIEGLQEFLLQCVSLILLQGLGLGGSPESGVVVGLGAGK